MTLLEQAKATRPSKRWQVADREAADLAIAWLKGEITDLQASAALKCKPSNMRTRIVSILKSAQSTGLIDIRSTREESRS